MSSKLAKSKKEIKTDPSLDPWQEKRRDRIAFIMELIESENEVDERRFLGFIATKYGIKRSTLKEYMNDLQDYGVIEVANGKIKWVKKESEEG